MAIEIVNPEPNVLLGTLQKPFSPDDVGALQMAIVQNRKTDEKLYVICDLRHVDLTFNEIVQGMAQSIDGSTGYRAGDAGVEIIMVTDKAMNKILVEFYKQEQYGGMHVPLYSDLEAAKAYVAGQHA